MSLDLAGAFLICGMIYFPLSCRTRRGLIYLVRGNDLLCRRYTASGHIGVMAQLASNYQSHWRGCPVDLVPRK